MFELQYMMMNHGSPTMGRFGPTLTYCVGKIHHFSVSKPNKLIKFPKLSNIGLWLNHGGSNRPTTLDINGLSPSISVNAFLIHRNPILMYDLGNFSALCCDFVTDSSVDSQVPGAPDFFFRPSVHYGRASCTHNGHI